MRRPWLWSTKDKQVSGINLGLSRLHSSCYLWRRWFKDGAKLVRKTQVREVCCYRLCLTSTHVREVQSFMAAFTFLFIGAATDLLSVSLGTNGANLGLPDAFGWNAHSPSLSGGSTNSTDDTTGNCIPKGKGGWIFAAVNAAPYLMAGM
jgi:hypothetical protein